MFRIKYRLAPECIYRNVEYVSDVILPSMQLETQNELRLPIVNKSSTTKTVFIKGLQTFNESPNIIKSETNANKFTKTIINLCFKENYKIKGATCNDIVKETA